MAISLIQIVWSSALTFIPCELSERVSYAFNEINDLIWTIDWHKFPVEMQKMIPIILIEAQSPVSLKCFGSISCNRDLFKRVRITTLNRFIFTYKTNWIHLKHWKYFLQTNTNISMSFLRLLTALFRILWCLPVFTMLRQFTEFEVWTFY